MARRMTAMEPSPSGPSPKRSGHPGSDLFVGGETVNGKGKTDILVRHHGQTAFIGECKFWDGRASSVRRSTSCWTTSSGGTRKPRSSCSSPGGTPPPSSTSRQDAWQATPSAGTRKPPLIRHAPRLRLRLTTRRPAAHLPRPAPGSCVPDQLSKSPRGDRTLALDPPY
jgi:hypothetical protein